MGSQGDTLAKPVTAAPRVHRPSLAGTTPAPRWVPIRLLSERHRRRVLAHLLSLGEGDRYLRFGHPATDEQIERYVDGIDFRHDEVLGIFNRRLELIALAHLAYPAEPSAQTAEFGVSVIDKARGRGYGARLFERAALHARNRGIDSLIIHALSENTAMLRIARNAGATVDRSGAESQALLKLPPQDLASRVGAAVEDSAAEIDYRWKVQARRLDGWLKLVTEIRSGLEKTGRAAES
jgi:RimJ/RimL family protein N-acetyltransferase